MFYLFVGYVSIFKIKESKRRSMGEEDTLMIDDSVNIESVDIPNTPSITIEEAISNIQSVLAGAS